MGSKIYNHFSVVVIKSNLYPKTVFEENVDFLQKKRRFSTQQMNIFYQTLAFLSKIEIIYQYLVLLHKNWIFLPKIGYFFTKKWRFLPEIGYFY